jgi:hypothetical protein
MPSKALPGSVTRDWELILHLPPVWRRAGRRASVEFPMLRAWVTYLGLSHYSQMLLSNSRARGHRRVSDCCDWLI